jgi:hypothetical protein
MGTKMRIICLQGKAWVRKCASSVCKARHGCENEHHLSADLCIQRTTCMQRVANVRKYWRARISYLHWCPCVPIRNYLTRDLICADGMLDRLFSEAKISTSKDQRCGDTQPHAQECKHCQISNRYVSACVTTSFPTQGGLLV